MNEFSITDYSIEQGGKHIKVRFQYRGTEKLVVVSGSPRTEHAGERIRRDVKNIIMREAKCS